MYALVFSKCEVGDLCVEYRVSCWVRAVGGLVLCLYFSVLCEVLGGKCLECLLPVARVSSLVVVWIVCVWGVSAFMVMLV